MSGTRCSITSEFGVVGMMDHAAVRKAPQMGTRDPHLNYC